MCLPPPRFTIDNQHPKTCSFDLRNPLPGYTPSFIRQSEFKYHKGNNPNIKNDVLYEEEENLACVVIGDPQNPQKFCEATDLHFYGIGDPNNDVSVLRYRAYYPVSTWEDPQNGHNYIDYPLPCVVLFYAGGFKECPDYVQPGITTVCEQLALRGYIAITVDYRSGRILDNDGARTSVQQQLAPYRGIQDGRGAIRSIVKRNLSNHGDLFTINTDQFFIGGQSAGAIIALGVTYYRDQAMINQVFPTDTGSLTIENALGHINSHYYYGEPGPDLENPKYWPRIRGMMNCWRGINIPYSFDGNSPPPLNTSNLGTVEKGFFQATSGNGKINPPMIGFAGALDTTIPFVDNKKQNFMNSVTLKYKSENFCLATTGNFILKDPSPNQIFVKQCSAQNMYYILKELNKYTELYVDCNMKHGINDYTKDNFGVNATNNDDVFTYIAVRTAIFFQTIMNVTPLNGASPPFGYTGKSLFRSLNDTSHITNQRTCGQCEQSNPCTFTEDDECP